MNDQLDLLQRLGGTGALLQCAVLKRAHIFCGGLLEGLSDCTVRSVQNREKEREKTESYAQTSTHHQLTWQVLDKPRVLLDPVHADAQLGVHNEDLHTHAEKCENRG